MVTIVFFSFSGVAPGMKGNEVSGTILVAISAIQGDGKTSPMVGETVTIEGIVVGDFQERNELKGFFVQSDTPDDDPSTSEGIFVYDDDFEVCMGDRVRIVGDVKEYKGLTEIAPVNAVAVIEKEVPLPEEAEISLPLSSDDELESYEAMRVKLTQRLTVSDVYNLGRYGQFTVSNGRLMNPTSVVAPGEEAQALDEQNDLNQIMIGDPSYKQNPDPVIFPHPGLTADHSLRSGHEIENVVGVLRYSYGYQVHPTEPFDIYTNSNPRHPEPPIPFGNLTVASYNVLNYFNGPDFPTTRGANTKEEFIRQRDKIIQAISLLHADVVGLMEIENDGFDENSAIQDLVNGLNEKGTRTFTFVNPGTYTIGSDEITVGMIYYVNRVEEIGKAATIETGAFAGMNRQPLAQSFKDIHSNEVFTVVVNHFKSKRCNYAKGENADQGDGQGCWNPVRTQASIDLLEWLNSDPTGENDPDILIIGDLNAYAMEDPIQVFEQNDYVNLACPFIGKNAYSYVYFGQAGYLDYAISSPHLTPFISSVHYWHINTDEPKCLDYNVEYKSNAQIEYYYSDSPFRSSDHDPVVIGLDLKQKSMWPITRVLQVLSDFDVRALPSWDVNGDEKMGLEDVLNMLQSMVE